MATPKSCPVCASQVLQPITRNALVTFENGDAPITGVLAYRCGKGHVFLIGKQDGSAKN